MRHQRAAAGSVWPYLRRGALTVVALGTAAVAALRWVDPPTSSFMVAEALAGQPGGQPRAPIQYHWTPLAALPAHVPLAMVAAEDQRFPAHRGFDLPSIRKALQDRAETGRSRGASTISQQVARNLFLWRGRSWVRKGLEACLTLLIELAWPKRRILEVYVNVAQFGERVYGVGAAARHFFGKPATALTVREAALLAAVLPDPYGRRADAPSPAVRSRAAWIEQQMGQLGPRYLAGLR